MLQHTPQSLWNIFSTPISTIPLVFPIRLSCKRFGPQYDIALVAIRQIQGYLRYPFDIEDISNIVGTDEVFILSRFESGHLSRILYAGFQGLLLLGVLELDVADFLQLIEDPLLWASAIQFISEEEYSFQHAFIGFEA